MPLIACTTYTFGIISLCTHLASLIWFTMSNSFTSLHSNLQHLGYTRIEHTRSCQAHAIELDTTMPNPAILPLWSLSLCPLVLPHHTDHNHARLAQGQLCIIPMPLHADPMITTMPNPTLVLSSPQHPDKLASLFLLSMLDMVSGQKEASTALA
jgi:hypothetical protein